MCVHMYKLISEENFRISHNVNTNNIIDIHDRLQKGANFFVT